MPKSYTKYLAGYLILSFLLSASPTLAAYDKYIIGDTVTVGEFVYDDNFQATTTPCTVSIYNPLGTLVVNSVAMAASSTGWHSYDFNSVDSAGLWPATIVCGSEVGGDLAKLDKTFIVASSTASTPSASAEDIATAVWNNGDRTITSSTNITAGVWGVGTSSFATLVSNIWSDVTSPVRRLTDKSLSSGGNLVTESYIDATTPNIAAAVWSDPSKFATLISNMWGATTRTLTGASLDSGSLALQSDVLIIKDKTNTINWADVTATKNNVATLISEVGTGNITGIKTKTDSVAWGDITGLVTASGQIKAKTDTISWADVTSIKTKTDTINWSDITGIKTSTDTIVWGDVATVKNNVANLITEIGTGNISGIKTKTDTIAWTDVTGLITTGTQIASKTDTIAWTDVTGIKTKTDSIAWSDVTGIKTKTDTIVWGDVEAIKAKTDTINWTNIATLISEVGTGNITGIKTKTDSIAWSDITGLVTSNGQIKAKTDNIAWTDVAAIKTNTDTINWADVTAVKTKTDTIVWGDVTAIKTNVATLITEIGTGNISAIKTKTDSIAWSDIVALITTSGQVKAKTDTIAWTDVAAIKTKTDTIAWTDVTGIKTKTDSINWSNIATLITEIGTGNISAIKTKTDDITWTDVGAIKAKTDTINWGDIALIPLDVWGYSGRTLTNFGTLVADVWNNTTRTLTAATLDSGSLALQSDVTTIKNNVATLISEVGTGNINSIKTKTDSILWSDVTGLITSNGQIKAKTDNVNWADVTAIKTKTDTVAWSDVTGIKTKTDTIVWNDINGISTSTAAIKLKTDTINWADINNLPLNVWSYSGRTLTNFGNLVSDVWNNTTRNLTDSSLNIGSLASQSDVTTIKNNVATLISEVGTGNIAGIKTNTDSIAWSDITGLVTTSGQIKNKTDNIAWSDVSAIKTKTDTIAWSDVTGIKTKTDTITWGDISTIKTNIANLITEVGTGNISAIKTKTDSIAWSDITGLITSNGQIKAKTDAIAWTDVAAVKTKTDTIDWADVTSIKTKTNTINWTDISAIKTKTDTINWTDIALIPFNTWSYSARSLTNFGTLAADIWNNSTRTLTNYGNDITAADVWSYAHSGQSGVWTTSLLDTQSIQSGTDYRAKVYVKNASQATNSYAAPTIYIYDVSRNIVVSSAVMTNIGAGVYEYVYHIAPTAVQGNWETIVKTEVTSGNILEVSDYFDVQGSPAQVIINSISDDIIPSIGANVTITNEGLSGYEYQYSWCILNNANDICDGVNDVYYATAAKYINPGENWNTNLTANVSNAGNYYFKLTAYFGSDSSESTRSFTAKAIAVNPPDNGGGGGGGAITPIIPTPIPVTPTSTPTTVCTGADFNHDKIVNSIDFSILLSFWKKPWPYKNTCVDINTDKQVGSVDFSILMYQWGKKK